jgi:hypothetical protein
LCASPDIRLEQQCEVSERGWSVSGSRISLSKGLAYEGETDPVVAGLVAACDGKTTLGELISRAATSLQTDAESIRGVFLDATRRLVAQGFLLPAGRSGKGEMGK